MPVPHQPICRPGATGVGPSANWGRTLTILEQDVEALLHEKSCVEDDEPEAEWENIVTGADFEEILDLFLCRSKVTRGVSRTVPAQRCSGLQPRQGLSQSLARSGGTIEAWARG